jgi:hypothetical protein
MEELRKYIENLEDDLIATKYLAIKTTHYTEKRSKRLGIVLDPDEYSSEFNPDIVEHTYYKNEVECFANVEEALDFGQVFERVGKEYVPYVPQIKEPVKTTKTVKVKAKTIKVVKGTGFNKQD